MKKIKVYDFLFYLIYTLMVIYHAFSKVVGISNIRNYILGIVIVGLLFVFILQSRKYSYKSFILISLCLVSFFVSYKIASDIILFVTVLFIISSKNVNFNKFIKYDLLIKSIIVILVIFLYEIGLTEVVIKARPDGTIRKALGFGHPNILGAFLFSICLDIVYIYYKSMKPIHYIILIVSFFINLWISDSRATQIGIILLIIVSIQKNKNKKFLLKFLPYIPILLCGISLLCSIFYTNKSETWFIINKLTSSRIKCAYDFYNYYGINLFGHFFEFYGQWGEEYQLTVLDNAYMHILIQFGLINMLIILFALTKAIKRMIKDDNIILMLCFCIILIYGLMELYVYQIVYIPMLLYIGKILYCKENKNE